MKSRSTTTPQLKRSFFAIAVMALCAMILLPLTAGAETPQQKIDRLNGEISQAESTIDSLESQANTLENRLAVLTAEKNAIQTKIDRNEAAREDLVIKIEETKKKIAQQQEVLGDTLGDLYIDSEITPIEMLASSRSIGDYIDQQSYQSSISDGLQESIRTIKKLREKLAADKKEIDTIIAKQEVQRNQLADKQAEQNELLAATRGKESAYRDLVGDLKAKREQAEAALVASLSSGSYKVAPAGYVSPGEVIGSVGSTGMSTGPHLHLEVRLNGNVTDPSPYIRSHPVNPVIVSQSYGNADPMYVRGWHPGTDYAAGFGTAIMAIDGGMMYRGWGILGSAYGCAAVVEHSAGVLSIYGHMEPHNC